MQVRLSRHGVNVVTLVAMVLALLAVQIRANAQSVVPGGNLPAGAQDFVPLRGHVASEPFAARAISHTSAQTMVPLAVALPLHNEAGLDQLLTRLYNPKDPQFGHFLSSADFAQQFAPTASEYGDVVRYLRGMGLSVTATHPNRLIVDVVGSASVVERAFGTKLNNYNAADGRQFFAPSSEPLVASGMASKISAIVGLDSSAHWTTHASAMVSDVPAVVQSWQVGHGPGNAMTPADIAKVYSLTGLTLKGSTTANNGAGQTIALFELDGYRPADIANYVSYYKLRSVPLQNVYVDGYGGGAGSNAGEVTLDIELAMAVAPGAVKIMVYEAPNTSSAVIDEYNRIASDNIAKQVSTSWGLPELSVGSANKNAESNIFKQMAAQGQSMFAASGDSGAYDNRSSLSVDDPSSQPYVTSVGGTHLSVHSDGTYYAETSWNNGSIAAGAGGGGVSQYWAKPTWQGSYGVSKTNRNVPDVSLAGDPYTGYSVYYNGAWWIYGGTSCAAPLWAAYTALANQQRAAAGKTPIGFFNTAIYSIAAGARYSADFHDVADGSTNLYYPAIKGYDNSTGWGSFNGGALLTDIAGLASIPTLSISGGPSVGASMTSATISWSTNLAANSSVSFGGTAASLTRSLSSSTAGTSHRITLTGLLHRRTYYYVVASANATGKVTTAVKYFTTQ